jgi:hypothetical protein
MAAAELDLEWVEVANGYAVALSGGKVVARGPRGHVLKSVPAALRDSDAVRGLRELREWRAQHDLACLARVEAWMVRSLAVPMPALQRLWGDPAWQRALRDAVILPLDDDGRPLVDALGFLRAIDLERGVGVVRLDGETIYTLAARIVVPHPVTLRELGAYREFGTELQIDQGIRQLFRETWTPPADLDPEQSRVRDFSDGRFGQLADVTSRCRALGIQVSGRMAVVRLHEGLLHCEARYWIGSYTRFGEALTGDLRWVDRDGHPLRIARLGPVTYSEGMRMAAAIYAGRLSDEVEVEVAWR